MHPLKPATKPLQWWIRLIDSWAITLPWGIYCLPEIIADEEKAGRMLRHENCHVEQMEKMGLLKFYAVYWYQYFRYGYDDMPMEKEARARE